MIGAALCNFELCSSVLYTIQFYTVHCTVCSAVLCKGVLWSSIPCTMQLCTVHCCTVQACTMQFCTVQYYAVFNCVLQYHSLLYCAVMICSLLYCAVMICSWTMQCCNEQCYTVHCCTMHCCTDLPVTSCSVIKCSTIWRVVRQICDLDKIRQPLLSTLLLTSSPLLETYFLLGHSNFSTSSKLVGAVKMYQFWDIFLNLVSQDPSQRKYAIKAEKKFYFSVGSCRIYAGYSKCQWIYASIIPDW